MLPNSIQEVTLHNARRQIHSDVLPWAVETADLRSTLSRRQKHLRGHCQKPNSRRPTLYRRHRRLQGAARTESVTEPFLPSLAKTSRRSAESKHPLAPGAMRAQNSAVSQRSDKPTTRAYRTQGSLGQRQDRDRSMAQRCERCLPASIEETPRV